MASTSTGSTTSRRVYPCALPPELCRELAFVQRSLAVVGYRPAVQSLTLYELLLACPALLPAVARARQLIWDKVEELFELPCQVWPETTSLISWSAGASIGWHHDANRPYLAARHFSAVAYLSTQGVDFEGGTFCFQSGDAPLRVQPAAGTLVLYTADEANTHSVEPVTAGERTTLTMWFTLDPQHNEDTKVLSKLQSCARSGGGLPETMYVLQDGALDIRVSRLQRRLGVTVTPCTITTTTTQRHGSGVPAQRPPAPPPPPATTPQPPEAEHRRPEEADTQVVVQCCTHPVAAAAGLVADARSNADCVAAAPDCCCFSSLQDAVLTVCMLEWTAAAAAAAGVGAGGGADQTTTTTPPVCRACQLLQGLPEARQRLQQHLAQAGCDFERLLPQWLQLDALVVEAG